MEHGHGSKYTQTVGEESLLYTWYFLTYKEVILQLQMPFENLKDLDATHFDHPHNNFNNLEQVTKPGMVFPEASIHIRDNKTNQC